MDYRKSIVKAIFLSVLDYGDIICRHAAATTLKPLDSVYHSTIRFITGDPYNTHHCSLYNKAGWTSLAQRGEKHFYLFIHKALTGHLPPYISSMQDCTTGTYQTRSAEYPTLKVPRGPLRTRKICFSFFVFFHQPHGTIFKTFS